MHIPWPIAKPLQRQAPSPCLVLCIGRVLPSPVPSLSRPGPRARSSRAIVRGEIDAVYQLGHPIGFQSQIYAGETHFCRPLYDPAGEPNALKTLVETYPPRMRQALIDKHLFDAQFEIEISLGPAGRSDFAYVSQCLARATGFMVLVLYALNQRFFLNEKNAFIESEHFALHPDNFHSAVERILGSLGNSSAEMTRSVMAMRAVAADLRGFCAEKLPLTPAWGVPWVRRA